MRRFFEMIGILLFVLLILAEVGRGRSWRVYIAWSALTLGALGGVVTLVWRMLR